MKQNKKKQKKNVATIIVPIVVAVIGLAGTIIGVLLTKYTPPSTPEPERPVLYIYKDNQSAENHYLDISYMGSVNNGNDGSLYIDPGYRQNPRFGETCIEIRYEPLDDSHWAGMMWLSGRDNYPPSPPVDGVDTARVNKLTFWAKGNGMVKFFIENDTGAQVSRQVELTSNWQEYTLALPRNWEQVCIGFGWSSNSIGADGEPIVFYVDEIAFYE